jgi:hypothetical protein
MSQTDIIGYVTRTGQMRNAYTILVRKPEIKGNHLKGTGVAVDAFYKSKV